MGDQDSREHHLRELARHTRLTELVDDFPKFASMQQLRRFLVRCDLYRMIVANRGAIVECGVLTGSGLLAWAAICAMLEVVPSSRSIVGFDTFDGFPNVHDNDLQKSGPFSRLGRVWEKGDKRWSGYEQLLREIDLADLGCGAGTCPDVVAIRGDFLETGPTFIQENPHFLVSLLFLDFVLYEPTKKALELFLPRMGRGSIVVFDEAGNPQAPGETIAMMEALDLRSARIHRLPYDPEASYIVL